MKYSAVFMLAALTLAPSDFGAGRPLPPLGMPLSVPDEPKESRHRVERNRPDHHLETVAGELRGGVSGMDFGGQNEST